MRAGTQSFWHNGLRVTVLLASVLVPIGGAQAAGSSSIAFGDRPISFAVDTGFAVGERPSFLDNSGRYEQWQVWLRHRGGVVFETTTLGTQVGVEYEGKVGGITGDSRAPGNHGAFVYTFSLGAPLRVYAFNAPFDGAFVLMPASEFDSGGRRWWVKGPHVSFSGTLRLVMKLSKSWHSELDYRFTPFVLNQSHDDVRVFHTEHRGQVMLGFGPVALGVQAVLAEDRARLAEKRDRVRERSLHLAIEWRPEF